MHTPYRYVLPLMLTAIILATSGCGDKKETTHDKEPQSTLQHIDENRTFKEKNTTLIERNQSNPSPQITPTETPQKGFTLLDPEQNTLSIQLEEDKISSAQVKTPLLVITLLKANSIPSQAEAYVLSELQKQYTQQMTVIGVILHPQIAKETLNDFKAESELSFFLATGEENDALARQLIDTLSLGETIPVPLTLIYQDGKMVAYYEGAVPIEMLEHDIKTLLEGEH